MSRKGKRTKGEAEAYKGEKKWKMEWWRFLIISLTHTHTLRIQYSWRRNWGRYPYLDKDMWWKRRTQIYDNIWFSHLRWAAKKTTEETQVRINWNIYFSFFLPSKIVNFFYRDFYAINSDKSILTLLTHIHVQIDSHII